MGISNNFVWLQIATMYYPWKIKIAMVISEKFAK